MNALQGVSLLPSSVRVARATDLSTLDLPSFVVVVAVDERKVAVVSVPTGDNPNVDQLSEMRSTIHTVLAILLSSSLSWAADDTPTPCTVTDSNGVYYDLRPLTREYVPTTAPAQRVRSSVREPLLA